MKIIVDAMGGDNAPVSNVRGALAAVRELGVEVILVGRGEDILKVLKEDGIGELPPGLEIVHASEVVEMCDNPATAFKEKKDSSLTVGLNLLKNGDGAAFVSAGSTGALLSAATLMVKRIGGVRRAAMAPVVPTGGGGAVLIDCGATAEGTPEYLLQFAFMGSYYAERVLKRPEPKVGLLNIGAEPSKGTDLQREAYALLTEAGKAGRIHFVGNVEAREAGYGGGGKGVAMRAAGMGASVIVTEVDPFKALDATMNGFRVMPMDEAARYGDIFVTVTGCKDVITPKHFAVMKHNAILTNAGHFDCEVDVAGLAAMAVKRELRRDNIEGFTLPDGRVLNVIGEGRLVNLAAGNGHPAEIMDMSFSVQALALEWLVRHRDGLEKKVYQVPAEIDDAIGRVKLAAMGLSIDALTPEQEEYLNGWKA